MVPDLEGVPGAADLSLNLPVPKCYHAHYKQGKNEPGASPEPPESALILEDIRPLGFKTADFSEGLTYQQVISVRKILIYQKCIHCFFQGGSGFECYS